MLSGGVIEEGFDVGKILAQSSSCHGYSVAESSHLMLVRVLTDDPVEAVAINVIRYRLSSLEVSLMSDDDVSLSRKSGLPKRQN